MVLRRHFQSKGTRSIDHALFPPLALLFSVIMLTTWHVAGRLLAVHQSSRPSPVTPLGSFAAGFGLYVLWWLLLMPVLGVGAHVTVGLFVVCVLIMSGVMYRTWQVQQAESHHGPLILAMALLALPVVIALVSLGWHQPAEYTAAQLVRQLPRFGNWPDAVQYATYAFPYLNSTSPGWVALYLPVQLAAMFQSPEVIAVGFGPWPGLIGLFNGAILILLASQFLLALNITVRWSNLLLCAAGAMLVVLLFLPTGMLPALTSAGPLLLAMACLFAALTPLVQPLAIPLGLSALLSALSLTAAVSLHPIAMPFCLFVAVWWLGRALLAGLQGPVMAARLFFTISALIALPLLAMVLWQTALGSMGQATYLLLQNPLAFLSMLVAGQTLPSIWIFLWPALVLLLISGVWVKARRVQPLPLTSLVVTYAPLSFPAAAAMLVLALAAWPATADLARQLAQLLLPLWLVPLWHLWLRAYRHSNLRLAAFRHPWTFGAILSVLVLALGLIQRPWLEAPTPPAQQQMESIGRQLRTSGTIQFGDVVVTHGFQPAQTQALSLAMAHYAPVHANGAAASAAQPGDVLPVVVSAKADWLLLNGAGPSTDATPGAVITLWRLGGTQPVRIHLWPASGLSGQ